MSRGGLFTLPNTVSLSRLVLAGAFVLTREPAPRIAIIALASLTDFLDGWLARRSDGTSRIGALIDPIADRFFVFAAVSSYLVAGEITTPQYVIFLLRDVMTAIGFLVARSVSWLRPITFRARLLGKLVTGLQLVTLLAVILRPAWVQPLVLVLAVVSVASVADYTLMLWRERERTA
jgi:cardiolipin synthase